MASLTVHAIMVHAKYNLSWQTYSEHLRGMMSQMMTTTEFADVTLVSEDRKYIKAHRNILSACSPVLKDILSMDKNSSTFIYLRGIQYSELECILHYFYLGEATLSNERINEFLAVAKILEIKSLQKDVKTEPYTFNEVREPLMTMNVNAQEIEAELEANMDTFIENKDTLTVITNEQDIQSDLETDTFKEGIRGKVTVFDGDEEEPTTTIEQESGSNVETDNTATAEEKLTTTMNEQEIKTHVKSFKRARYITKEFVNVVRIGDEVVYTCKQCDNHYHGRWKNRISLHLHIKAKHLNVRYDCNECAYQAKYPGDLKKHIRNHQ